MRIYKTNSDRVDLYLIANNEFELITTQTSKQATSNSTITSNANVNFGIDAAYLKRYKTIESGFPIDRAGRFNYDIEGYSLPKLKINVFSKIKKDRKEINLNVRYISGYDNFKSLSSRSRSIGGYSNKVSSSLMFDLMYKKILDFNDSKLDLNISILNISDEQAPKVNSQPEFSFDPRQADPRGRMFSLGLQFNL